MACLVRNFSFFILYDSLVYKEAGERGRGYRTGHDYDTLMNQTHACIVTGEAALKNLLSKTTSTTEGLPTACKVNKEII